MLCLSETEEEKRRFAVKFQSEWIKKAADAGFRYAVLHPSGEPIGKEERYAMMEGAKHSVAELSEAAEKAGIALAVENLSRSCLGNC